MFRRLTLLLVLALPAAAADDPAKNSPPPKDFSVLAAPVRVFELFKGIFDSRSAPAVRLEPVRERDRLGIRQPGDPDSVISPGAPTPSRQFALRPSIEVNDLLLKAYQPDPTVDPHDNRTRGAGAWSPLDAGGRPYQLRLGARLVW